jgi:hypothetical protein
VRAFSQKGGNGHESVISIDRSGLYPLHHADDCATTSPTKQPETPMSRHLKSLIMVSITPFFFFFFRETVQ